MSNSAKAAPSPKGLRHAIGARIHGFRRDGSDTAIAKRMASTTFILRVVNAGIGLVSQVILARWMGEHEYGVYAYVWVWVLLLGGLAGLGLPAAAQRFIPEYTEGGDFDRLRGFLRNGGLLSVAVASVFALAGAAVLKLSGTMIEEYYHLPLLIALACVPVFVMVEFQEGVARSYSWADLAFGPSYLIRPLIILGGLGVIFAIGYVLSAVAVMIVSFTAMIVTGIGQLVILRHRLVKIVPDGGRRTELRPWLAVAWPLLLIDGFYLVLTYTDILVLQRFHPPSDVANYYAATKVMAIMSFIAFAVATSTAHRFAQYSISGDKEKLSAFMQDSVKWTFWPSVAVAAGLLVLGKPLLWLFGPEFVDSYYLLPLIAVGLLARAAVGPVDRLLSMAGEQNLTAAIHGFILVLNIALNVLLIPLLGLAGAAVATSLALAIQSVMLVVTAQKRLGISIFGRRAFVPVEPPESD